MPIKVYDPNKFSSFTDDNTEVIITSNTAPDTPDIIIAPTDVGDVPKLPQNFVYEEPEYAKTSPEDIKVEIKSPVGDESFAATTEEIIPMVSVEDKIKQDAEVEDLLSNVYYQLADTLSEEAWKTGAKFPEDVKEVVTGLYGLLKASPIILGNTAAEVYEGAMKMEEGEVQIQPNADFVSSLEKEPFGIMPDTEYIPTMEESAQTNLDKASVFNIASVIGAAYNQNFGISDLLKGDFKTAAAKTMAYADRDPLLFAADTLMLTLVLGKITATVGKTPAIAKYTQALTSIPDSPVIRAGELISNLDNPFTYINPIAKSSLKTLGSGIKALSEMDQLANAGFVKKRNVGFGLNFKADLARTARKLHDMVPGFIKKESQLYGKMFEENLLLTRSIENLNQLFMNDTTKILSEMLSSDIKSASKVAAELKLFTDFVNSTDNSGYGRPYLHYVDLGNNTPIVSLGFGKKILKKPIDDMDFYPKVKEIGEKLKEINTKFDHNQLVYDMEFIDKTLPKFYENIIINTQVDPGVYKLNSNLIIGNDELKDLMYLINDVQKLRDEIVASPDYIKNIAPTIRDAVMDYKRYFEYTPEQSRKLLDKIIEHDKENGTDMAFYAIYREGVPIPKTGNDYYEFDVDSVTKEIYNETVEPYDKMPKNITDEEFDEFVNSHLQEDDLMMVDRGDGFNYRKAIRAENLEYSKINITEESMTGATYDEFGNPIPMRGVRELRDLFKREYISNVLESQMKTLLDVNWSLFKSDTPGATRIFRQNFGRRNFTLDEDPTYPIMTFLNSKTRDMTDINLMPYERTSFIKGAEGIYSIKELSNITTAARIRNDFYTAMNQAGIEKLSKLTEASLIFDIVNNPEIYSKNGINFMITEKMLRDYLNYSDNFFKRKVSDTGVVTYEGIKEFEGVKYTEEEYKIYKKGSLKIETEIERGSPRTRYKLTQRVGQVTDKNKSIKEISYTKITIDDPVIGSNKKIDILVEDSVYDNFFYKTPAGSDPTPQMIIARMAANSIKSNLLIGTSTVFLNLADEFAKVVQEIMVEPRKIKGLFDPDFWKIYAEDFKKIYAEATGRKYESSLGGDIEKLRNINNSLKGDLYEKYDISKKNHEKLYIKPEKGKQLTKRQKAWNKYVDIHQKLTDITFSLYGSIDLMGKSFSNIISIKDFVKKSGMDLGELEKSVNSLYNPRTAAKWEDLRKEVRRQTMWHFDNADKIMLSKSANKFLNQSKSALLEFGKATSFLFTSFPMMALNSTLNRILIVFTGQDMWGRTISAGERIKTAATIAALNIAAYELATKGIDLSEITNFGVGADAAKIIEKDRKEAKSNSELLQEIVRDVYKDNVKTDGFIYALDEINKLFSRNFFETAAKDIVGATVPIGGSRLADEAQRFLFNTNTDIVRYIANSDSANIERSKTLQDIAFGRFMIKEKEKPLTKKKKSKDGLGLDLDLDLDLKIDDLKLDLDI